MSRVFTVEFSGVSRLTDKQFFGFDFMQEGVEITPQVIEEYLEDVTPLRMLEEWNLSDDLVTTVVDNATGAIWEYDGAGWKMIRERRLLPGEQRLFP
jgi:hypothetical protein